MHEGSRRAILPAFLANLGIAISKFVGFLITGSAGLLAAAGHSLADTGNQLLLLLGGKRAARAADTAHLFGHEGERSFWAFVVAVVLLSMGGLFALCEGIEKLTLAHVTGEPRWDALGSVAIGLLLVAIAILLAVEMKGLLIGESASPADIATIATALEQAPSVRRIIDLRTAHLGPDQLLVAAKLEFEPTLTVDELAAVIDTAEQQLRAVVPTHFVFIEPDTYRAATT